MNSNRAEVSRKQLADTVKRRWGTLIERQLKLGEGKRDRPNQVADSWITAKVQAEIFNEPSLKVARINVETCKHVVRLSGWLSGFVDATAGLNKAIAIARSVQGVIAVANHMQFR
jgi:osmotically-inducible protein OsmY